MYGCQVKGVVVVGILKAEHSGFMLNLFSAHVLFYVCLHCVCVVTTICMSCAVSCKCSCALASKQACLCLGWRFLGAYAPVPPALQTTEDCCSDKAALCSQATLSLSEIATC